MHHVLSIFKVKKIGITQITQNSLQKDFHDFHFKSVTVPTFFYFIQLKMKLKLCSRVISMLSIALKLYLTWNIKLNGAAASL